MLAHGRMLIKHGGVCRQLLCLLYSESLKRLTALCFFYMCMSAVTGAALCIPLHCCKPLNLLMETPMKTARLVLVMLILSVAGCKDRVEVTAVPASAPQPETQTTAEQAAPEPAAPAAVTDESKTAPQPAAPVVKPAQQAELLTEEQQAQQHELLVERLIDRLDDIMDEYYESDDEDLEEPDRDTLIEKIRQELPDHMHGEIPAEVMEEIEWWTE